MATVAWITLTAADIEARIPSAALAALRERFNLDGTDPLAVLIADTVARVRQAIATCEDYVLSADPATIPPELRDDAAWIVCCAILLRVPEVMPITDDHRTRLRLAEDNLAKVAACDLAIGTPTTAGDATTQTTGGVSVVRSRSQLNTRDRLRGLI
jgi:hypothetical protein